MKFLKAFTLITSLIIASVIITNYWVSYTARNCTYNNVSDIPKNKVGLVLGASKYTTNGNINLYYKYRVDAAVKLFFNNKIEFVLISGDNSSIDYDEPTAFKNDLIAKGIPENNIFLDYAGFRTLDSVVRAQKIFGQNAFTIISQKFHNERAIYLARHFKINAIGFNAKDVNGRYGLKTRLREYLARTKASCDIFFKVEPKFLGDPIIIK